MSIFTLQGKYRYQYFINFIVNNAASDGPRPILWSHGNSSSLASHKWPKGFHVQWEDEIINFIFIIFTNLAIKNNNIAYTLLPTIFFYINWFSLSIIISNNFIVSKFFCMQKLFKMVIIYLIEIIYNINVFLWMENLLLIKQQKANKNSAHECNNTLMRFLRCKKNPLNKIYHDIFPQTSAVFFPLSKSVFLEKILNGFVLFTLIHTRGILNQMKIHYTIELKVSLF